MLLHIVSVLVLILLESALADPLGLPKAGATKGTEDRNSIDLSDKLGPIVINSDGTTARITNWHEMTEQEKDVTKRRIMERNRKRMKVLREQQDEYQGRDL